MALIKTLIAGGAGYIGQQLVKTLLDSGRQVIVLDNLLHNQDILVEEGPNCSFLNGDIRDIGVVHQNLSGCDEAILLASLVGEPACDHNPDEALEVNYLAALNFALTARISGLKRLVFASTDSCYGQREGEKLTEDSPLRPLSFYAKLKSWAEVGILGVKGDDFSPTIVRLATVYGLAPRMRFDLAVNLLTREATLNGKIKIFSGEQYRPLVHVSDVARAIQTVLDAPYSLTAGQVYNVGSNEQNIQFKELGRLLAAIIPETIIETVPQSPDLRDYYVCFDKITKELGFEAQISLADGIKEIHNALKSGHFADPYARQYVNFWS
jgi:nucleoside-diphosphate-sugar epimerase